MEGASGTVTSRVEEAYRASPQDPEIGELLRIIGPGSDDDLAELIEVDGRTRIGLRRSIGLNRYLDAIPDLAGRELPLDAAIDVVLREMSGGARPTRQAIDALTALHPELRSAIGDAAMLGKAVVSTTGVSRIVRTSPARPVPSDFGPRAADGVPRYELKEVLGSGSTGEVYLAVDRQLSEPGHEAHVAIKVISVGGQSTRARLQLAEEASKARRVVHDHVVRVFDKGASEEGEDYIVYEFVDGGDLDKWFEARGRKLTCREAATMVAQIARGLQAAHVAGLVHCDLKPSNILVTEGGSPKVADFGIAVRESDLASMGGDTMRPIGNVAFISPEQYRGEPGSLGVLSDVYALGGVLFYLLTGHLPNGGTVEEVARTHALDGGRLAAPDPRVVRSDIDLDLARICVRSMALRAGDRHASPAALADDLESWVAHEPISWQRPSMWKVVRLAARRRPGVAVASAVAALSILLGAGAGGYWASVAGANRIRADEADHKIDSARLEAENGMRLIDRLRAQGMGRDLLQIVMALEGTLGSRVLGSPEVRVQLWERKIQTVRETIAEYEATGRSTDVETLMWQGLLGFWLLNVERYEEAVEVLDSVMAKWEVKGLMGDALARQTGRLAASAHALQLGRAVLSRPLTENERARAGVLETALTRALTDGGISGGYPSREHVLAGLVALYGPDILNRPRELVVAQKKLDQHREKQKPTKPAAKPGA